MGIKFNMKQNLENHNKLKKLLKNKRNNDIRNKNK